MFARVFSGGLMGVDAYRIEVEVDCCGGIGQINIVGLPDAAVKESQERVRSAIKSCSFLLPPAKKWVVNLAPADTKKEGPAYDLPIAMGILASCQFVPIDNLQHLWLVGELGLDGGVRPVSGVLPLAIACKESGGKGIIVPEANAEEAALVEGLLVFPVSHLAQAALIIEDMDNGAAFQTASRQYFLKEIAEATLFCKDLQDVKGQQRAKRGLELAAAGRHNLLMVGPPGAGKSMLAERLPGIMPPLSFDEALELTKLYSVAGLTSGANLVKTRPFRAPHHSASVIGLVGGGSSPKPGEISLSHHGILFLDELTEFPRFHLDNLRQPLETQKVTISRASQTLTYPASFLLIGACNPCPCGYRNDPIKFCICTPGQADRYWSRLSGPLLDRIDIHVQVRRLREEELIDEGKAESSKEVRKRVIRAVNRQMSRNVIETKEGVKFIYNSQLPHRMIGQICRISDKSRRILASSVAQYRLSARAYDRILRMSRTIADLADSEEITDDHIAEAVVLRTEDTAQVA